VLVNETDGVPVKPVPVRTTVVGPFPSLKVAGAIEVIVGAAFTVKALASVEVPLSSVTVRLYVPGVVDEVEANVPVTLVAVSPVSVKVAPGAVEVTVTLPPSAAKVVPVTVNVPEAPSPKVFVAVPCGENATDVTVVAPAAVAIARGSAAAASKAPAASAFTKWRCIRRGLFMVNSLHS
jgi:hypothetical protein